MSYKMKCVPVLDTMDFSQITPRAFLDVLRGICGFKASSHLDTPSYWYNVTLIVDMSSYLFVVGQSD